MERMINVGLLDFFVQKETLSTLQCGGRANRARTLFKFCENVCSKCMIYVYILYSNFIWCYNVCIYIYEFICIQTHYIFCYIVSRFEATHFFLSELILQISKCVLLFVQWLCICYVLKLFLTSYWTSWYGDHISNFCHSFFFCWKMVTVCEVILL